MSRKNPQIVDTIEHFSDQIREASQFMKFDEFGIRNGAAIKVVKQDWKNGRDLDNICSKVVLGKDINQFAETQITTSYKNPQGPIKKDNCVKHIV